MKRSLSLLLVVTICFCIMLSSCKKNSVNSTGEITDSDVVTDQNDYKSESESFVEEETTNDISEAITTAETEQTSNENKTNDIQQSETEQENIIQNKTTVNTALSTTSKSVSNNPKPASQDFKSLENILNWDGGAIEYADSYYFNYKTDSVKRFIEVAESSGFVPAYRVYIDENMFANSGFTDIDNDGYDDIHIPLKGFNWVLKNIYNYTGSEISRSNPCGCNIKGDNIYFWIPPDEGGVYGKFSYKNYTVSNNVYKVKFDYYENFGDYGEEAEYVFDSVYTVTAAFKTVRNVNNTGNINVWSIYSIEKTENYKGRG